MNRYFLIGNNSRIRNLLCACLLMLLTIGIGQVSAETSDHHQAYLEALDRVLVAETNIANEMDRISNGSVQHYDFLQFEHIELLRFSNALRHPPSQLSESERDHVAGRADALFIAAQSLELVIADFLRGQALLASATGNILDLVASLDKQELVSADRNQLQQLDHATRAVQAANTSETLAALETAFDRVLSLNIDNKTLGELQVQLQLIVNNAAEPAAARVSLDKSGIVELAEELRSTYFEIVN